MADVETKQMERAGMAQGGELDAGVAELEAGEPEVVKPEVDIDLQARIAAEEGFPFLFSVVIAVYNAEQYVAEAVESVLGQTLGADRIQIVLVDDGSVDGSAGVCQSYAVQHPNNVVFISKENGGVSSARNAGLDVAKGKYVNFLDSDDLWTADSLEWALAFFAEHPEVRIASAKYVYFGAIEGDHRLNYKFEQTRVANLLEDYDCPQLSSSTCFFEAGLLEGRRFNEQLSISEDVLFVNEILLDELRYGLMSEPEYRYRQHEASDSAINTMKENMSWYLDTPELCYKHLFDLSQERFGEVLPFIQYTVMYDLQWRVGSKMSDKLNDEQVGQYRELLEGLLRRIDDHIITEQKTISLERVAYSLVLKYGIEMDDVLDHMGVDDGILYCDIVDRQGIARRIPLRPAAGLSNLLVIEDVRFDADECIVSGYVNTFRFRPRDLQLYAIANNAACDVSLFITNDHKQVTPFGEDIAGKTGFEIRLALGPGYEARISAELSILGEEPLKLRFKFTDDFDPQKLGRDTFASLEMGVAVIDRPKEVDPNCFLSLYRYADGLDDAARADELESTIERYRKTLSAWNT